MVLNYLFTGLIVALLSVPGTGQKEVATVGEQPVVKEETVDTADPTFWVKVDDQNIITEILGYVEDADMQAETGGCDNSALEPCARGYNSDPGLTPGSPATGHSRTWYETL